MLLSLASGLAIMLAGAVFLFQLAGQSDVEESIELGSPARVGDMDVTVDESTESDGSLVVTVRLGGVDDSDGASGFRLIASGRPVGPAPIGPANGGAIRPCGATTVAETTCVLRFDVTDADGTSRVLFYDRGDERARWVLG